MSALTLNQEISLYERHFLNSSEIVSSRRGGRFNSMKIYKCKDDSEWVVTHGDGGQRFKGYLYLNDALAGKNVSVAETKMTLQGRRIEVLSRYVGEERLGFFDGLFEVTPVLKEVGFEDFPGGANLRKGKDGKVWVFDTEYGSFDTSVHGKLNAYQPVLDEMLKLINERNG